MATNKVKKQHYISQGLLKHFSEDGVRLYEHRVSLKKTYKASVKDAMSERDTYEHPLLLENMLEQAFAKIEASFIPQINKVIEKLKQNQITCQEVYGSIEDILDIFLLFYYRSGALLSEFAWGAGSKKEVRIKRLLEIVTDRDYLRELSYTLKKGYSFTVIYSEEARFLLSDQYVSTVALSYKNTFLNTSNRAIGMKDTLILFPLSSQYYIVFFNGPIPEYIQPWNISKLSQEQADEINVTIYQNAFSKCVSQSEAPLHKASQYQPRFWSPVETITHYENEVFGSYVNKKEVFLYAEDAEICENRIEYHMKYREIIQRHGKSKVRNIECPCGSGKKFKKCCIDKYRKAYQAVEETQMRTCPNYGVGNFMSEMPINEFWGIEAQLPEYSRKVVEQIRKKTNK